MRTRIISAVIILPVLFYILASGGIALYITLLAATLIGYFEFFRAVKMEVRSYRFLAGLHAVMSFAFYLFGDMQYWYALNILLILIMLTVYALYFPKVSLENLAFTMYAIFYILFLMMAIAFVRDHAFFGNWMVWLIFAIAFGSDSCAYFVGVRFGKRKLVPNLSPNKTVEGAIGGLFGAGLIALIYALVMYYYGPFDSGLQIGLMFFVGLLGSVVSQVGDLAGSAMKRQTGIKDFGRTIPGHGGILDRLDSILVTAAYVYLMQQLLALITL